MLRHAIKTRVESQMYRATLPSVLILSLLGCACLFVPPTEQRYEKEGLSFTHYSNWRVVDDEPPKDDPGFRTIDVEGPDEAIVMFTFVPPKSGVTLEFFAEVFAEGRLEQLKKWRFGPLKVEDVSNTSSEPITRRIGGRVQNGILQRFTIKVLGEVVPHEARFFMVENKRHQVFIMTQAAAEDLPDMNPAFDLILDSFSLSDSK